MSTAMVIPFGRPDGPVPTYSAVSASASGARASGAGASGRTRLRLTRRGRIVFTALGAAPVVALVVALVLGSGPAAAGSGASHVATTVFETITVGSGDTLWEIAAEIAPQKDPRDVIDAILRLNGLDSAMLEPGQQLALPAFG